MGLKKKRKVDWSKFKEGTTAPLTFSMASLCFTFFVGLGAATSSYQFFISGSWGLGIMFIAVSWLQIIGVLREWKQFNFLKSQEKTMENNKDRFNEIYKNMKDMNKVRE